MGLHTVSFWTAVRSLCFYFGFSPSSSSSLPFLSTSSGSWEQCKDGLQHTTCTTLTTTFSTLSLWPTSLTASMTGSTPCRWIWKSKLVCSKGVRVLNPQFSSEFHISPKYTHKLSLSANKVSYNSRTPSLRLAFYHSKWPDTILLRNLASRNTAKPEGFCCSGQSSPTSSHLGGYSWGTVI